MIRVRFAPSPTGDLHVGGARTALFNWLFARKNGGTFILRIEDTDGARNTEEASAGILKGLKWLGLDWDEGPEKGGDYGPYYQSQRKEIYDRYLAKLTADGRTYVEENGAVRFKFSRTAITVHDLVCGDVTFAPTEEPDMTLRRPDGSYIFHFVNVVDDIEMEMTHVFRGEDHLSNTWKHIDLFNAFGATPPTYAHIPLILNSDSSKMSKRDAGSAIESSYMNGGFLPDAVFNYLCLLGWTPRTEAEVLDRATLTGLFEPAEIHSSNARFDLQKCSWFNAQYLRALSPKALFDAARPFLHKAGLIITDEAMAAAAVYSVREKVSLLTEIPDKVRFFFDKSYYYDDNIKIKFQSNPSPLTYISSINQELDYSCPINHNTLSSVVASVSGQYNIKPGSLMPLIRYSLSGQMTGPDIGAITEILGPKEVKARFERTITTFSPQ